MKNIKFMKKIYCVMLCVSLLTTIEMNAKPFYEDWDNDQKAQGILVVAFFTYCGALYLYNNFTINKVDESTVNCKKDTQSNSISKSVEAQQSIVPALEENHSDKIDSKSVDQDNDEKKYPLQRTDFPENIADELAAARQTVLQNDLIEEYRIAPAYSETLDLIANNKEILLNAHKSMTMKGKMKSPSISLSGFLDVANLMGMKQVMLSGNGLVANSFSNRLIILDGNFIIESSLFYGQTSIEEDAMMESFNGCYLDDLFVYSKNVVIELRDTVVAGNIFFEYPGILVMDRKTIVHGSISNVCIMVID